MCNTDHNDKEHCTTPKEGIDRRSFLKFGTAATLGLGMAAAKAPPVFADSYKIPPLPENNLTPDEALAKLMAGNRRYAEGKSIPPNFAKDHAALLSGQNPYASILCCSDSRVSPEFCFDEQHGDLFVARVAGNYLTTDFIATLEYSAAILHTPLIMVMGHESCGAAKAAIDAVKQHQQFPGHMQSLASALAPAVRAAEKMPGDLYQNAIRMNVVLNVERLKQKTPIINKLVSSKEIKIVGGMYSLKTGKVELVA